MNGKHAVWTKHETDRLAQLCSLLSLSSTYYLSVECSCLVSNPFASWRIVFFVWILRMRHGQSWRLTTLSSCRLSMTCAGRWSRTAIGAPRTGRCRTCSSASTTSPTDCRWPDERLSLRSQSDTRYHRWYPCPGYNTPTHGVHRETRRRTASMDLAPPLYAGALFCLSPGWYP